MVNTKVFPINFGELVTVIQFGRLRLIVVCKARFEGIAGHLKIIFVGALAAICN